MNIRRFWRLCSLTVASFFWASCSESNPQFSMAQAANPDSSADANGEGFGDESSSSAIAPESSSSENAAQSSSSDFPESSSAAVESSSSGIGFSSHSSSSIASSSSSVPLYALARDTSVSCSEKWYTVSLCENEYSCDELKTILGKKQSVSEKLLSSWEEKLESCEAISEDSGTLYGVGPCASTRMKYVMKCSNDSSYSHYQVDQKLVYTSTQEYNVAHGIVPEDLVESCPQGDYALFIDVLADVQKVLYEKCAKRLEEDSTLTEEAKMYLEGLLDHEKKALNSSLAPYLPNGIDLYNPRMYGFEMKRASKHWFNGFIAKTETCENASSVTTETYQQKYDGILAECIEIIENKVNGVSVD